MANQKQPSQSKELSQSEIITRIEYFIDSEVNDVIRLQNIIKVLKNQKPLCDSDQSYLNSLMSATSTDVSSHLRILSALNSNELSAADENKIISIFSNLNFIKSISYSKSDSTIRLVVVHNDADNLKAFDLIGDTIIALEDKLPDYFIEPWILHESEVQDSFLSGTKKL